MQSTRQGCADRGSGQTGGCTFILLPSRQLTLGISSTVRHRVPASFLLEERRSGTQPAEGSPALDCSSQVMDLSASNRGPDHHVGPTAPAYPAKYHLPCLGCLSSLDQCEHPWYIDKAGL